jgi:hypothetical protein
LEVRVKAASHHPITYLLLGKHPERIPPVICSGFFVYQWPQNIAFRIISYKNPSPFTKGRGIKGEGLVNNSIMGSAGFEPATNRL